MRAALFDLDGVLIDTEGLYTDFWAKTGREYGIPDPDFALSIKGNNLEKILSTHFPDSEVQKKVVNDLNRFEADMPFAFFEGAERLISELKAQGWKCALVTSSDKKKMASLYLTIPQLQTVMDAIVTGDMVSRSKPDPEGYLLGAKLVGVHIEDCIVFEDSFAGLQAGRSAGAKVVGLATTNPRETLTGKADRIYDAIAEITLQDLIDL